MITTIQQDIKFAGRMLWKNKSVTFIAIIALALGIGANTAIFSVVNAVLLKPLPYRDADRLVWIWGNVRGGSTRASVSPPDFFDYRAQNNSFEHLAASTSVSVPFNLTGAGEPERLNGSAVTTNYFQALGVEPALGRTFLAEEEQEGRNQVVVLSHGLWQRRFGSDTSLVGKTIILDGRSVTVVGVMPAGVQFPQTAELWVPLFNSTHPEMQARAAHFLRPIGRLKPGVTLEQAQAEMDGIARRLEEQYPESNARWSLRLVPLQEQIAGNVRPTLLILLGAVGFVLLIACANVANLLLARAAARQKEIAIRTALGASRARIVRQLLTESLLLAVVGGLVGVVLALWSVDLLVSLSAGRVPRAGEIGIDAVVLGFTLGVSLLTGLVFGLVPALQASKPDFNESLKEGGKSATEGLRRNRIRSALVVAEVALALVLLVGAGLLVKSFIGLQRVSPGFDAENVLTMRIDLSRAKYATPEAAGNFYTQLQERVSALPGVEAVGMISELPLSGQPNDTYFTVEGRPAQEAGQRVTADYRRINHDYFRAMTIPLLRGRYFSEQDFRQSAQVAIISETMAERFFPNEDPLGKRLLISAPEPTPYEIVGIVGDVRHRALDVEVYQMMYVPTARRLSTNLVVRTATDPSTIASAVRNEVWAIDRDQPVSAVRTMGEVLSQSVAQQRFTTSLLGIFAAVAMILAAVGIYGVMAYSVTQRTREIGVRLALGAQTRDVFRLVVGQGMLLTIIGVAVGLVAAIFLTRLMESLLFGVSATDPTIFVAISFLLIAVALLACYVPARRATRVDPMEALRYE